MVSNIHNLAAASHQVPPGSFTLPENDAALFEDMLDKWRIRRRGAKHHMEASIEADISVVKDMLSYTGTAPWYWNEDDFDAWCDHLGIDRRLAVTSQRKYQSAIRSFFTYIVDNPKFRNQVRQNYGLELRQLCHSENCIPHVNPNEKVKERCAMSHQQIEKFFDAVDMGIKEAALFKTKDFRPLQRDKVFFYILYIGGLRISEALKLNIDSFDPNPMFPEFGDYGFLRVWGKGSKGSGPKFRLVPVTHPLLPDLLDWYIKNVRSHFLSNADANEKALFLSERGNRLAISTGEERFQHSLIMAGLDGLGFTPHCLRHSSVSHEALRFGLETNRRKHGHVYGATTQGYMHIPDEIVNDEITHAVSSQLDLLLENK